MSLKFNEVQKVLIITLFLNLLVAGCKIYYGYKAGLISMISDGFHSLMDSSSNVVAMIAIYISLKPPDRNYHYGYKKYEAFASMVISILLIITTYEIISSLINRVMFSTKPEVRLENVLVMVVTIAVNFFVTSYEGKAGKKLKSKLLLDDSSHTASDILVSFSVLFSIIAIKLGFPVFDFLASAMIVFIITLLAWKILQESIVILSDSSALPLEDIEKLVLQVEGVNSCHKIRTRGFMDNIHIDLHIQVEPELTITMAHEIGHRVQNKLRDELEGVKDVITHVEPTKKDSYA
jgi:cation diffusion facilitator family transporter